MLGLVVNNIMDVQRQSTFHVDGLQVCGTLVHKNRYGVALNNQIRCQVKADSILALRNTHSLTTNGEPLTVVRSKARISPFTEF
jgi:hypothetical protein